jgi:hypothetical protein
VALIVHLGSDNELVAVCRGKKHGSLSYCTPGARTILIGYTERPWEIKARARPSTS